MSEGGETRNHTHSWQSVWRCRHCGQVHPPLQDEARNHKAEVEIQECPYCKGARLVGIYRDRCPRCAGTGVVAERSPQGEDHEAVRTILERIIEAAAKAGRDGTLPAETVRVECLRATYALSRCPSPERDTEIDDWDGMPNR